MASRKADGSISNFHYHDSGYHPLLCYDGHTHDLIQIQLLTGNVYSSDGTVDFLQPVLNEYRTEYKDIRLNLRGDSGLPSPPFMTRLKTIFERAGSCAWKREIDQIFWSIRYLDQKLE